MSAYYLTVFGREQPFTGLALHLIITPEEVAIADMDALETGVFGNLLATKGMATGGGGKVVKAEVGIECQQTVRDFWMQPRQKRSNTSNLHLVYIPGHQKGTGNEER